MKRTLHLVIAVLLVLTFIATLANAAEKRGKFGTDERHDIAKRVDFKTSDEKIRWKMVMPWSKGLLFYDIAVHFADSVRLASAGRLDIKPFSAGELVPADQTFDSVSQGSAQIAHSSPLYWKGKGWVWSYRKPVKSRWAPSPAFPLAKSWLASEPNLKASSLAMRSTL